MNGPSHIGHVLPETIPKAALHLAQYTFVATGGAAALATSFDPHTGQVGAVKEPATAPTWIVTQPLGHFIPKNELAPKPLIGRLPSSRRSWWRLRFRSRSPLRPCPAG